ncbi:MAG TPA: glycosyltransferase family 4 protein [Sphingomicrobium sp.]|jgi:glycosyltransferase involved in cell wall biosynthesis|nr:glycosyltransferase family 4 protein [Sphingomicrobium sp.]
MKRLLWIGDACVDSGFARATHYTMEGLDYRLRGKFDCSVLGLNYLGDPHPYPYNVYPCWPGQDMWGVGRLEQALPFWLTNPEACGIDGAWPMPRPDVVVVQNDPWNVPYYTEVLKETGIPIVASVPVDGKNCRGGTASGKTMKELGMNALALTVFWTEFGRLEAELGGYEGPAAVVPLGVDRDIYHPYDKAESRRWLGLPIPENAFLAGYVGRNQPRKRLDLTLMYFAEWIKKYDRRDAYLFVHCAPTGEMAFDLEQLVRYLKIQSRVIVSSPEARKGETEETLARLYSAFDVHMSTSQSEGFHLPSLEAMACGCVAMAGNWSALGDWARGAAYLVPCTGNICTHNSINVIGGLPDREAYVVGLEELYSDPITRRWWSQKGLDRAAEPRFDWKNIGDAFAAVVEGVFKTKSQPLWKGEKQLRDPFEVPPKPVAPKLRVLREGSVPTPEPEELPDPNPVHRGSF